MSVVPLPAATVVLLRDGGEGPEAFLTKRLETLRFAPGCHVFPGGRVDERDAATELMDRFHGPTADEAGRILGGDPSAATPSPRAFWIAGLRELFEEAGVLLASRDGRPWVPTPSEREELGRLRRAINAHERSFAEVLARLDLTLRGEALRYFDHWITPERETRRFNTRFFLARLPEGQEAGHYPGEASESGWYHPWVAVEGWRQGTMPMFPPTVATLLRILQYARASDVFDGDRRPIPGAQSKA